MARRRALAFALPLVCAAPSAARADAPPAAEPAASPEHDAVFKSGLEQYSRGNYVSAIATWESLLTTIGEDRGYKVLYNLGLAYQQIGDTTKAIERFRSFEHRVAERPNAPPELAERARDAAERAKQLEQSHGAVHVLAPKRGGLVLTRIGNGEPRAAGYTVWLAPGTHAIDVYIGTDHEKRVQVDVEPGSSIDVETTPEASEVPPPVAAPPPREAPPEARPIPSLVWIGAGATAASLALPVTLYVVANGKRDDADALGAGHTDYAAKRSTYVSWRTAYYVSYALPVTLAAATAAIYLLRPEAPSTKTALHVGPGSVSVSGQF